MAVAHAQCTGSKDVLHKIDLPANLDAGLRGRRGKSPETNETVTQLSKMPELTE